LTPKSTTFRRTLLIGYNGGVARAFLALLEKTPLGKEIQKSLEQLFLLDQTASNFRPQIERYTILEPQKIQSSQDLESLILKHNLTEVIDLSSTDTVDCTRICDKYKVNFLCTSVEEWPGKGSIPTDQAISRLSPS
jgi:homospermidine synthase